MKTRFALFFAKIFNVYDFIKNITDSKILDHLSHDEDWRVRSNVAYNFNTSVETLEFLSCDKFWNVRCNVARNSNTPKETLNILSRDEVWDVRWMAAQNSNTSFETLKQMAIHDEDDYIRYYMLKHPNCNDELYMYIQGRFLLETLS